MSSTHYCRNFQTFRKCCWPAPLNATASTMSHSQMRNLGNFTTFPGHETFFDSFPLIMTHQWPGIVKTILTNKFFERYFDNDCNKDLVAIEKKKVEMKKVILMFFNLIGRNAPIDYYF